MKADLYTLNKKYQFNEKEKEELLKMLGILYLNQMYTAPFPSMRLPAFYPMYTGNMSKYGNINNLVQDIVLYDGKLKNGSNYLKEMETLNYLNPFLQSILEKGGEIEITMKYSIGKPFYEKSKKDTEKSTEKYEENRGSSASN